MGHTPWKDLKHKDPKTKDYKIYEVYVCPVCKRPVVFGFDDGFSASHWKCSSCDIFGDQEAALKIPVENLWLEEE